MSEPEIVTAAIIDKATGRVTRTIAYAADKGPGDNPFYQPSDNTDLIVLTGELVSTVESGDILTRRKGTVTAHRPAPPKPQLSGIALLATLLAVNGTLTLDEAAATAGLPPAALVHEAKAWSVA